MIRRILVIAIASVLATAPAGAFGFKWKSVMTDASRTGVTPAGADNVSEAMGRFEGRTYVAPNGARFRKRSSTARAAKLMIEAHPSVAHLMEVVGYSPEAMRRGTGSLLSDWAADCLRAATAEATGRQVDIAVTNHGGIRVDMPKGDVTVDDLMSMFPFKNYICYVSMKGSDVLAMFNDMADRMQAVSGVKVTIKDHKVQELLIGGEPVDPDKVYGIGTVDFVLNGGDGIFTARNAVELVTTDHLIFDGIMDYVRALTASGKYIEQHPDGRIVNLDPKPERK